ncbi:MAG: fumarylacetoacetase [Burkholderiales bacterium]|jgi:fumarylacetoacetase|nr:fumarylacetoacetase [Burkholderiales bacterium]MBP6250349.1 fumarylacetoacetase [Leptothrix sp. (in: b-proteobacteria)]MBP7522026.1 fumarylacetoacetase [Leptothrix sp. (in: b-proteobacteria)]
MAIDATHDPAQTSWVASAQALGADFPIQNLPFGRIRRAGSAEPWRIGVAIGDQVLDLAAAALAGGWSAEVAALLAPLAAGDLNAVMAQGSAARRVLRSALQAGLKTGSAQQAVLATCLIAQAEVEFSLPCTVHDYTDFYTGIHHATAVGKLFRPDNPLLPNYKWVPIGYHGRASSLVVSGTAIRRPNGQFKLPGTPEGAAPDFGPCRRLDYELELGAYVGRANALGEPVPIGQAEEHLFGVGLFNDWSARDLQAWEYQPLGPFLAKNFGSTVSPWIVTMEALAPFRQPFTRPEGDPQPLPYLDSAANREAGAFDIQLQVRLQTAKMREAGEPAVALMQSNFRDSYWTLAQLLTHHTVNGCNLNPGDLLGSGTQSGPQPGQGGSLLELTGGGKQPITLPNGETRTFLQDGDSVELHAWCEREGTVRIGFGPCAGVILPAP